MKVLIAYDGSDCSKAAIDELRLAGLPAGVDALVVSVGEVFLPPPPPSSYEIVESGMSRRVTVAAAQAQAQASQVVTGALAQAEEGAARVRSLFPSWDVSEEALTGVAPWEIIRRAEEWPADLIVVGTNGRNALGRLIVGSVSKKVVAEARCSVRVARPRAEREDTPVRVVVGFDGSPGALGAVREVARRAWPASSEARVVFADTYLKPSGVVSSLAPDLTRPKAGDDGTDIEHLLAEAVEDLRAVAGLRVRSEVVQGDPKRTLVEEAERFGADCIFVGSRGLGGGVKRLVLGSVSSSLVSGSPCTVEVVKSGAAGEG